MTKRLKDYIAFDLEFNTVDDFPHLIQVAAVKYQDHQEVATFDSFVYSKAPLKSVISGLTGITVDKIQSAPPLEKVLEDFKQFVGQDPLIGYNGIESDIPVLKVNGLDLEDQYQVDVYLMALDLRETYLRGSQGMSLVKVADHLGIKGRGHHALEDARMTAKVYQALLDLQDNASLIQDQETLHHNPFAGLDLSQFLGED